MIKKIILIILGIVLLSIGFYQIFLKEKKSEFTLAQAVRGNIVQEVFESGQVVMGEKVSLSFKNAGRVEEIYVQTGNEVKAGQEMAKLNISDLEIQLQEAFISLELAELNLNKLLAGASLEEIEIAKTQVENIQISLSSAEENLKNSYQTALNVLDGSVFSIYSALDFSREFVTKYIVVYDDDARKITQARNRIEAEEKKSKEFLNLAKESLANENIETAISTIKNSLEISFNSLEVIREMINRSTVYYGRVSSADKTSLETLKANINIALSKVIASEQSISLTKLSVEIAEKNLEESKNRLDLIRAEARKLDIDLYQAQVRQAEVRVNFYKNQIKQSILVSPINGIVTEIKKEKGELAQPTSQDVVIVVLPIIPYEIKVDIYEGDIVKISDGNLVEISFVAFPGEKFEGKVSSISPAEKIIDNVVYYESTISIKKTPENIRPSMTADVLIQADLKEDVLTIHRDALQRRNGRTVVEVFENGLIKEREIEVGVRGTDDMVEVLFGLEEGEKIVIWK